MAGLFPSISGCQNVDANGKPLAGATLTVYNGGTLQLSSVFQDIGLAIPAQNPMVADLTGRLPFFYVADGTYRVRLVDQFGGVIFDYAQLASIGASSSGGGGSGVDPTTIFQTGDDLWTEIGGIRSGWVRQNGLTIGSATSGASERANSDCQNLFLYLWNNYSNAKCPVVGGRGVSAAADWAANKQITLPDKRGRSAVGADGMGNTRANILPDGNVTSGGSDTGDTPTAFGGEANHTLTTNEIPSHTHSTIDTGHDHGVNDPTHSHTDAGHGHGVNQSPHSHAAAHGAFIEGSVPGGAAGFGGGGSYQPTSVDANTAAATIGISIQNGTANIQANSTGITLQSAFTGISIQNAGGGSAHNNMQPFVIGYWFKKL